MKRYFVYISVLMLLVSGCVYRHNIKRDLPKDWSGYSVFIVDNYYKGSSFTALTESQFNFLFKHVRMMRHYGLNCLDLFQTVYVVKDHILEKRVSERISTNAAKFPDKFPALQKKSKTLEKNKLLVFVDSLENTNIPYFLMIDTLPFYNQVYLTIEYKKGKRPSGAGRSTRQQYKLDEEIRNLVRELFRGRLIFDKGGSIGGGLVDIDISVPINSETEIPPDLELRLKEKFSSITKVSIGKMEPIKYQINYFVESP